MPVPFYDLARVLALLDRGTAMFRETGSYYPEDLDLEELVVLHG